MIKQIPGDAVAVIESFQPYRRPTEPSYLADIQAIDNWAKHKAIPNLMSFRVSHIRVLTRFEITSFEIHAFNDGDEMCRVRRVEPVVDPEEHFRSAMQVHVSFSKDGPGKGFPLDFLQNTHEFIHDTILPAFQPFFET